MCGTDLHIYLWDEWSQRTIRPGLVIGHEFVGRIAELGPSVTGYKIGQRVSAEGHIVCGHCRNCRGGRQHLCPNTIGIGVNRSDEHTSELQSLMRISYAVFCLKNKK